MPDRIVLDFDGTDDPAHGHQEGVSYHGYYAQHMLHPLLLFDGAAATEEGYKGFATIARVVAERHGRRSVKRSR